MIFDKTVQGRGFLFIKRTVMAVLSVVIAVSMCITDNFAYAVTADEDRFADVRALGDANGDGKINMADVVAVRRYLINREENPLAVPSAAEVTGDGKINMADVIAMRRYLINSEKYPFVESVATEIPTEVPATDTAATPEQTITELPETPMPTLDTTEEPTAVSTAVPTEVPTKEPTEEPTAEPTGAPTEEPTEVPTAEPTEAPTEESTEVPTEAPTEVPTEAPTEVPTEEPTAVPTEERTAVPTEIPTAVPTEVPTAEPTEEPTAVPTEEPTPTPVPTAVPTPTISDDYQNKVTYTNTTTVALDSLDRNLTTVNETTEIRDDRYVGIFYFLWAGEHGTNLYDNSIIAKTASALTSEENWIAAGGGGLYEHHFWGKPMFGYYLQSDPWVMRKHVQMLTDADVDFLVIDATNAYTYTESALKLLGVLNEYGEQGWDVPQIAFMTNTESGTTMNKIYDEIYDAYPEYSHLWFNWDGKPLIIGNSSDANLRTDVKAFFRIKSNQWPNEARKDDGFPWMEFARSLSPDAVYGLNGRKEVANVSLAQHSSTVTFSYTAWYGANDRTRSWHDGANDTAEDAYLYGYNFAEQFEWAIEQDPEIIFITGWNEWVAQRQAARDSSMPIVFVDCADANTSRDVEPMEGGYGDNYYMQMISYIRKYKGTYGNAPVTKLTIDVTMGFAQWNDVPSYYKDFTGDIAARDYNGFGSEHYTDSTGRNDIEEMKVSEDNDNIYFFVKTVDDIVTAKGKNWMNLYISTDSSGGWHGYNFVLNNSSPKAGKCILSELSDSDTFTIKTKELAKVNYRQSGNMMMVEIPKSVLGISGDASFSFKWSDNCTAGDIFGFYKTGDAAPIGRAGYYYGN